MDRRGFLSVFLGGSLGGLVAAPAVILTPGLLMPVRKLQKPKLNFQVHWLDEAGNLVKTVIQDYDDPAPIRWSPATPGRYRPQFWCNGQLKSEKPAMPAAVGDSFTLAFDGPPITVEGTPPPDFPYSL